MYFCVFNGIFCSLKATVIRFYQTDYSVRDDLVYITRWRN